MHYEANLTLTLSRSRSSWDHHLNLVGPTSPMLHTKSQGHWPSGSGEEDFTIYGRDRYLSHVTIAICVNFG